MSVMELASLLMSLRAARQAGSTTAKVDHLQAAIATTIGLAKGKSETLPMSRDAAEQVFLEAASVLASYGADEVDLRDLLNSEYACLDRSTRRQSVRRPGSVGAHDGVRP